MMLGKAFQNIDIAKKTLDAAQLRHDVLSNNIANVNTPGYKRQDVAFEDLLSDFLAGRRVSMAATHAGHMTSDVGQLSGLSPSVFEAPATSFRIDDNGVNIDTEMAELAKNSIKYNAVTTELNAQLRRLKSAISGGR